MKNGTEVTLNIWSNLVGNCDDETFHIKYFWLIHKFQERVMLLQMVHMLI